MCMIFCSGEQQEEKGSRVMLRLPGEEDGAKQTYTYLFRRRRRRRRENLELRRSHVEDSVPYRLLLLCYWKQNDLPVLWQQQHHLPAASRTTLTEFEFGKSSIAKGLINGCRVLLVHYSRSSSIASPQGMPAVSYHHHHRHHHCQ